MEETLKHFINTCNDFIDAKFLSYKKPLINLLESIRNDKKIFGLIEYLSKNIDVNKEISKARVKLPTKPGYFVLPKESEIMLPLVYAVIEDICLGRVDGDRFLNDYFLGDEELPAFRNFANQLVVPFKTFFVKNYEYIELDDVENIEKIEDEKDENSVEDYINIIENLSKDLLEIVKQEVKLNQELKDDAVYLLNTLISACEKKEIKYINSLIIALGYMAKKIKCIRFYVVDMKQHMYDFYSK